MNYIRHMKIEDYEQVFGLWTSIDGMGLRPLDDSYDGMKRLLRFNPTTCFVCEVEGVIVASILCGCDGRRGYIYHCAVAPSFRNKGIATALVQAVQKQLVAMGICKAALLVYEDNQLGNAFWESLGWQSRTDVLYRDKPLIPQ